MMDIEKKFDLFFEKTSYSARCDEFIKATKRGQENYEVVLPWSHYHALRSSSAAKIFSDPALADKYASENCDEIITTNLRNACSIAAAFDILCAYAWTPNQSSNEATESRIICEIAQRIISHDSRQKSE